MKKIFFIVLWIGGLSLAGQAQNGSPNNGGRIEAFKIAYLTKRLNLSTQEAQKFWPIYNQYSREIRNAQIQARQNKEDEIKREERILAIRKKYNGEFAKALSAEKVNLFFRAEKDFGAALQRELMERRQQRLNNRRPNLRQN